MVYIIQNWNDIIFTCYILTVLLNSNLIRFLNVFRIFQSISKRDVRCWRTRTAAAEQSSHIRRGVMKMNPRSRQQKNVVQSRSILRPRRLGSWETSRYLFSARLIHLAWNFFCKYPRDVCSRAYFFFLSAKADAWVANNAQGIHSFIQRAFGVLVEIRHV
jgi:hypothetical protein